jgi:hypothetical protein
MPKMMMKKNRPSLKVMPNANHPLLSEDRPHMTGEKLRKWLRHPTAGGFPVEGPATWPRDKFTFSRIQDGDVVVVGGDEVQSSSRPTPHPQNTRPQ